MFSKIPSVPGQWQPWREKEIEIEIETKNELNIEREKMRNSRCECHSVGGRYLRRAVAVWYPQY